MSSPELLVCVIVATHPELLHACRGALSPDSIEPDDEVLRHVRGRSAAFLAGLQPPLRTLVIEAPTLADAERQLRAAPPDARVGLCFIESRCVTTSAHLPGLIAPDIDAFFARLDASGIATLRTPDAVVVFIPDEDFRASPCQAAADYRVRAIPASPALLAADVTALATNYVQHGFTSRFARRRLKSADLDITLGVRIADMMDARFGREWLLSYYTGSVVSSLIKTLQRLADERGALSVRGPNEHALACASFINWRLYRRGYAMVLTSAMIDELKGTLANLQQVRARGLIVCADSTPTKWFGFQATLNSDADIRRMLAARNVPFVYLQSADDLAAGTARAAELLDQHDGPVVIVATQAALEARTTSLPALPPAQPPVVTTPAPVPDAFDAVLRTINHERVHLLWQCGALTGEELRLTLGIAQRAGIALVEALSAPGFLPTHRDGAPVTNHIGMLGQYGTNDQVFDFLHTDGSLNSTDEQVLFVLKGKLGQIDSPYSDNDHERKLRIVQINARPDHIAPFVSAGLAMPVLEFLQQVDRRLQVDPEVLGFRESRLRQCARIQTDVFSTIPTLPMHPNYFFGQLASLMRTMIVDDGYRHTGLYDVGHCGTLGVRWLPRTDPSFSGWYGRGLMGDALLASMSLAVTGRNNVVAIVGDGARQLTPDVLPGLLENLVARGRAIDINVTVFVLANNLLSVINSYQERLMFQQGGRQMVVVNAEAFAEPDVDTVVAGTRVIRRRLLEFDGPWLRDAMQRRGRVNLITVPVAANNDGISIFDAENWQVERRHRDSAAAV